MGTGLDRFPFKHLYETLGLYGVRIWRGDLSSAKV
jgi:hypothetical protein